MVFRCTRASRAVDVRQPLETAERERLIQVVGDPAERIFKVAELCVDPLETFPLRSNRQGSEVLDKPLDIGRLVF
jgi:hypothetical protein